MRTLGRAPCFLPVLLLTGVGCGHAQDRSTSSAATPAMGSHVLLAPDALRWRPLPAAWIVGTLPPGVQIRSEVAVVHGDPEQAGTPFVIRLRSPGNSVLPVHWHAFDEMVTVLSGVWCVGMGDKIDPNACTDMPAGSFIFLPKHMHHWAVTKDSVVEVHGIGPFRAHLVQ